MGKVKAPTHNRASISEMAKAYKVLRRDREGLSWRMFSDVAPTSEEAHLEYEKVLEAFDEAGVKATRYRKALLFCVVHAVDAESGADYFDAMIHQYPFRVRDTQELRDMFAICRDIKVFDGRLYKDARTHRLCLEARSHCGFGDNPPHMMDYEYSREGMLIWPVKASTEESRRRYILALRKVLCRNSYRGLRALLYRAVHAQTLEGVEGYMWLLTLMLDGDDPPRPPAWVAAQAEVLSELKLAISG